MNQVSYLRGTTLYPPSPMNITSAKALGGGSQLTQLTQLSGEQLRGILWLGYAQMYDINTAPADRW